MSAISLSLLCAAAAALGGVTAYSACALRDLRRQVTDLSARLAETDLLEAERTASVPAARNAAAREIRAAVNAALADERERELAEARAFWAARESRYGDDETLAGHGTEYVVAPGAESTEYDGLLDAGSLFEGELFIPRQSGPEGPRPADDLPSLDDFWTHLPDEGESPTTVFGAAEEPLAQGADESGTDASTPSDEKQQSARANCPENAAESSRDASLSARSADAEAPEAGAPNDAATARRIADGHEARHGGRRQRSEPALDAPELETELDQELGDLDGEPEPPELTAARRRHPSNRDFDLRGDAIRTEATSPTPSTPAVPEHERTVERLAELACARTPLADVRPGPLGTLDVYVFEDGTTICLSPGHRDTSERLGEALRSGKGPFLLGGSSISGAYALTFAYGDGETAYLLADRVIASL